MVNLRFNAIDVETANRNRASICQIGIAQVRAGKIDSTLSILVNPEEPFEQINTSIHGISESTVRNTDPLPVVYSQIYKLVQGTTLISHTPFDQQALEKAASKYGLPPLEARWLDSAQIARRAWPERYATGGWALKKITADLGITFQHHNAEEDARAVAEIFLQACRHTGMDVDDWLEQYGYARTTTHHATTQTTDQPRAKTETPSPSPTAPPRTPWVHLLSRILALEESQGFNNTSVIGGMDAFIRHSAQTIAQDLGDSGVHRVLATIAYDDLTQEERHWWTQQWHVLISKQQEAGPDHMRTSAVSHAPARSHVRPMAQTPEVRPPPARATSSNRAHRNSARSA